jgi:hypothetical protein
MTAVRLISRVFKDGFTGMPFSILTVSNELLSETPALGT